MSRAIFLSNGVRHGVTEKSLKIAKVLQRWIDATINLKNHAEARAKV